MVKRTGQGTSRGRAEEGVRTRARMVETALQTLVAEGYAGTSARVIAARGGFNPALVFYHYGGVDELLLAALDASSAASLERYRQALSEVGAPVELVRRASDLFRQDIAGGHVTAVTELIGAGLAKPELRGQLVARMQPWLDFTREFLERVLAGSGLEGLEPAVEPAAFAIVSGYLGLNMLTRLMPDLGQTLALFTLLEQVAALVPAPLEP